MLGDWFSCRCVSNSSLQSVTQMSGGDDADVYKTTKQYEEDRQKYTVKEMEKLRQYYIQV